MSQQPDTSWDVLNQAHSGLRDTVAGIRDTQWDQPTPCSQWNVTQVVQHAAGDQLAYVSAITGGPGPDANPFEPSGHIDGTASSLVEAALSASSAAWATIGQDDPAVPTPLPQGAFPAATAVGACALDAAVHAWDLAAATGQPSRLNANLAAALMPVATSIVEPLRAYGAYAAALEPAVDDDAVAALLRYLGRSPSWTA